MLWQISVEVYLEPEMTSTNSNNRTWIVSLLCTEILLCYVFLIFVNLGKKTQWYLLSLPDVRAINLGISFVPNLSELHVLKISFTRFLVNLYTVTFCINFLYLHEGPRILLTSFKNCLWIEFYWLNFYNFVQLFLQVEDSHWLDNPCFKIVW